MSDRNNHNRNRNLAFTAVSGLCAIAAFLINFVFTGNGQNTGNDPIKMLLGAIGSALVLGLIGGIACLLLFDVSVFLLQLGRRLNKNSSAVKVQVMTVFAALSLGFIWGVGQFNCIYLGLAYYCPAVEFDSKGWKESKILRYKMIDSLVKTKQLKGLTEKQLIQLLGKPDSQIKSPNGETLYYNVGDGHLHIYEANLSIYFIDGLVSKYQFFVDS